MSFHPITTRWLPRSSRGAAIETRLSHGYAPPFVTPPSSSTEAPPTSPSFSSCSTVTRSFPPRQTPAGWTAAEAQQCLPPPRQPTSHSPPPLSKPLHPTKAPSVPLFWLQ